MHVYTHIFLSFNLYLYVRGKDKKSKFRAFYLIPGHFIEFLSVKINLKVAGSLYLLPTFIFLNILGSLRKEDNTAKTKSSKMYM